MEFYPRLYTDGIVDRMAYVASTPEPASLALATLAAGLALLRGRRSRRWRASSAAV
jgi:hypothetical protein